jgi:hypothetical protein
MKEYLDINIGLVSRRMGFPNKIITDIGVTYDPTLEQCESIGYREIEEIDPPPEGMTATAWEVVEMDSHTCHIVCTAWIDPVAEAEKARLARIAAFMAQTKLVELAHLYRITLRQYFGTNAETNREVTKDAVAGYFIDQSQVKHAMTKDDLENSVFLQAAFETLTQAWGPDSQGLMSTWELPWELIP